MGLNLVDLAFLTTPTNELWNRAGAYPSLDLRFAENKSLVDAVTGASLVTSTRASRGTYVDSAGVLRTAVTNLLVRSEEFDSAPWNPQSTAPTITANTAISPSGTLTADTITFAAADSRLQSDIISFTAGVAYTFSIYARAVGTSLNRFRLAFFDGAQQNSADFTVSDLTWTRITATFIAANTAVGRVQIRNATDVLANSLFFWGAQLEQSSTVGEYVPTGSTINSAPRFDHNPLTGESRGLLVEEQRTNLRLNSATFQPSSGGTPAAYTVDQVAPDGTTTGSRQTAATPRTFEDYTGIANALYTFSFYCRVTSGTAAFSIQLKNAASDTVITSDTSPVATTAWRRFTISGTTAGATPGARVELVGVVPGFVLWGAQLEAGATASSYIPTTTAAATRNADVVQITGTNFSSWYRQDEGTVYAETRAAGAANNDSTSGGAACFSNGTNTERIRVSVAAVQAVWISGNTTQATLNSGTGFVANALFRAAAATKTNNFAFTINANVVQTSPSGSVPSVSQLNIGSSNPTSGFLNGHIRRLTFWPQRLSNATLPPLTQ